MAADHAAESTPSAGGTAKVPEGKGSLVFSTGHELSSPIGGRGFNLTDSSGAFVLYAATLEDLAKKVNESDKVTPEQRKAIVKQLGNKKIIENFLMSGVCRPATDVVDIQVQPTQDLIDTFEKIRNGEMTPPKQEIEVSLNTINDNFLHGLGRAAGMKKGSTFEGDDQGQTFGMDLNALIQRGNNSVSVTLLDRLYTRSGDNLGKAPDGSYYQEALNKSALNVSVVRSKDPNGNDTYFFRFEGEVGCHIDQGGLSQSLQKVWHEASGSKQLSDVDHMEDKYYLAGRLGVGRKTVFFDDGRSSLSALVETGVQGGTVNPGDNALYCSANLTYDSKFCQLEIFADANTSGNYKIGAAASKKLIGDLSITGGAYYEQDEITRQYGDSDLIHELGFKMGF